MDMGVSIIVRPRESLGRVKLLVSGILSQRENGSVALAGSLVWFGSVILVGSMALVASVFVR